MSSEACLGVSPLNATRGEIRRAYRIAVRYAHPDKTNGVTSELFAIITAAYNEMLQTAEARNTQIKDEESMDVNSEEEEDEEVETNEEDRNEAPWTAAAAAQQEVDADPIWERMFWDMTGFKLEHGHCYVPRGTPLGAWGIKQRLANERNKLSAHRRARLDSIEFNIDDLDWRFHVKSNKQRMNKVKKRTPRRSTRRTRLAEEEDPENKNSTWTQLFCAISKAESTGPIPADELLAAEDNDHEEQNHCGGIFFEQTQLEKENFQVDQDFSVIKNDTNSPVNSTSSFFRTFISRIIGNTSTDASFSDPTSIVEDEDSDSLDDNEDNDEEPTTLVTQVVTARNIMEESK
eukprot:CAMPEP_0197317366 /NCGR_PEP_ID=MMETSP0891-20130614/46722_1 /TAXON_ID=44058 ORGANISM="Aureoumbra lagunensis, Strain CCMP1510" /NCGR_SAMPLE_ID=MMETSP0891 /ASSEMBLY_ACC=CAM_ASM_000534 /LENGTH=346 /DNA_ID=CAMNT_0042807335 /DNA_START=174 /DNA_END=1214 /DNA_ORIENTATION=+